MTELVRDHRHGERHPIGSGERHSLAEPGADRTVGDLSDTRLLHSAVSFVSSFKWYFQSRHHHLHLADLLRIGKLHQAIRMAVGGARPAVVAALLILYLSVASCTKG